MGTSADYSAPPSWSQLKGDITRAGHDRLTPAKAGELLRDYIGQNGGSSKVSSGRGLLGSGGASKSIATSFGGFVQQVADVGLAEALRRNGLNDIVGHSAQETLLGILSLCGGKDGSIDSVDARNAFSRTMDDLCGNAETAEDLEKVLNGLTDGPRMVELLTSFFANYLFEQFCRVFFGQLIQKHGEQTAQSFLTDIFDFIKSRLQNHVVDRDAKGIDWFGQAGKTLVRQILQDTLTVFET